MSDRLGGALARKPLHFIFVLDVSGSMLRGGRIQALNNAITEVLPHLRDEARANPHAELLIRVLAFANEPQLDHRGADLRRGPALAAARGGAQGLHRARQRAGHPRRCDARDGEAAQRLSPGDHPGLRRPPHPQQRYDLRRGPPGAAQRAVGRRRRPPGARVGRDADMHSMRRFIGNEDVPLLRADNPEQLVEYIVWASKAASRVASRPVRRRRRRHQRSALARRRPDLEHARMTPGA